MKIKTSIFLIAVVGLYLSSAVSVQSRLRQGVDPGENIDTVVASLITAKTAVDRINILDKDTDFVFDFTQTKIGNVMGKGGHIVNANRATFPAVTNLGIAMAAGFLGPCGLNTPHVHPRATEFLYAVNGSLLTGFVAENGARPINNTIYANQGAIFPQGSIHFQANIGCDPVLFVAGLNNEDPGVNQIAQNFFAIDPDVISATLQLGVANITEIKSYIPDNVALGLASCLKQCGLDAVTYY